MIKKQLMVFVLFFFIKIFSEGNESNRALNNQDPYSHFLKAWERYAQENGLIIVKEEEGNAKKKKNK